MSLTFKTLEVFSFYLTTLARYVIIVNSFESITALKYQTYLLNDVHVALGSMTVGLNK
jgi:hypothetical protein